jgi:hypothetical protein
LLSECRQFRFVRRIGSLARRELTRLAHRYAKL